MEAIVYLVQFLNSPFLPARHIGAEPVQAGGGVQDNLRAHAQNAATSPPSQIGGKTIFGSTFQI